jgi:PAT family beta-lactamase induction signal transducer AmpG
MSILKSYFQKPIAIILFLGFSSGLPLALILSTMKAFLVDRNVDITTIGFFALVAIPYSIKFLWAPLIDSIKIPYLSDKFGKRRSWIILTQISLIFLIILLGVFSDSNKLFTITLIAFLIAFFSASQDVAIDAYRIESVKAENQAIAASVYIYGYYVGMLVSGALALILSDKISWDLVYYLVGSAMLIGVFTTLLADEDVSKKKKEKEFSLISWFHNCVLDPFKDFMIRPRWYIIFLFILSFKLPDAFAGNLFIPFLQSMDFTKTQIGTIVKTFGLFATLIGALLGGIGVKKIGLMNSLWIAAILQIISNFGFYYLSLIGYNISALYVIIFVENLSGGIGNVVFVAYLSSLCNIKFTATQYALLASLASVARGFLSSPAGLVVNSVGYSNFFLLSILFGIPSLILLALLNIKKKLAN